MGHVYVVLNGSVVIHRALQENALATDPGARGGFGWCFFGLFQTVGSLRDVPSLPETNSKFALKICLLPQKERIVFQPSINFRGFCCSFQGG